MVYVDRTAAPVIKARVSEDGGRTWPDSSELIVHRPESRGQTVSKGSMSDAWAEMGAFSIGLPDTFPLADGEFLVTYYSGTSTDVTDVHWKRLRS